MKKVLIVAFVFLVCISLVFGIYNIKSIDSLIRPPKLSGENNLLQSAFEETVGNSDGIVMKNPLGGEYTSTYLFYDLDNDGNEEAFVFYSDLLESNLACVSIFKKDIDAWSFVSKITGKSEDIYQVDFADFNGDNVCEILLSWKTTDSLETINPPEFNPIGNRSLSIYCYDNSSTQHIKTETYSDYYIEDFNCDDSDDLFLVNINISDQDKNTSGRFISFNKDYSVLQDSNVSLTGMLDVYNIISDKVVENNTDITRIFIDGAISDNAAITEVVSVVQSSFDIYLPLYEQNQSMNPSTLRDNRSSSFDYDNDGEVEIPTSEKFPHSQVITKDSDGEGSLNLTVWNELKQSRLLVDNKCIYNASFKYMFIIPDDWINDLTAVYDYKNDTLTFYNVKYSGIYGEGIFSVKAFYVANWEKDDSGYTKFTENESFVYGYLFNDNVDKNEYVEYINDNFVVII